MCCICIVESPGSYWWSSQHHQFEWGNCPLSQTWEYTLHYCLAGEPGQGVRCTGAKGHLNQYMCINWRVSLHCVKHINHFYVDLNLHIEFDRARGLRTWILFMHAIIIFIFMVTLTVASLCDTKMAWLIGLLHIQLWILAGIDWSSRYYVWGCVPYVVLLKNFARKKSISFLSRRIFRSKSSKIYDGKVKMANSWRCLL